MSPSQTQQATAATMMESRMRFMPPRMRSTTRDTTKVAIPLAMIVLIPMYPIILQEGKHVYNMTCQVGEEIPPGL